MQASMLRWRSKDQSNGDQLSWAPSEMGFFEKHQVGQILSGLVLSSAMWGLLAVGVYAVYSLVLGSL